MRSGRATPTGVLRRVACPCLAVCLLGLAAGCKGRVRSVEHAEVTGRVLLDNRPLPGGRVTFVTVEGGFSSTGDIDERGNYSIQAPVGAVQIAVDNRVLQRPRGMRQPPPRLKRPGAEQEEKPVKGTYVPIPPKYYTTENSGLTYEVQPGSNSHDIQLENKRF